MCRSLTLLITLFFFAISISAQDMEITDATTPPLTPENLITNIFLGDGVEVLDVVFQGDAASIGYFKDGETEVGIERGIVLTSGRAASANCNGPFGANCVGGDFASNDNSSNVNDPDLTAIASLNINDAAKYTITFIPTADTLRFKYVFASEEYPEYGCSVFNDVFGFFISGPGINGPYQNNGINIALVPGTNDPVAINSVHPQNPNNPACTPVNLQFYNFNENTNNQPVYDGYLDVFVAEAVVIPCETYTIKLMIADVGDGAFDSGVFLEAKSFGTGSLNVETATVSLDGTITEGCSSGTLTFSMPGPVEADFPLDYNLIGTAINGTDYIEIPTDLFIPEGDSTISIDVVGIVDNIDENLESIGIDIQRDICNRDTFWIFIRDNEIIPPDLGPDTSLCLGDSILLNGTLPIPLPDPPTFTNDQDMFFDETAPLYSSILVAGVQPVTLGPGVIQSVCLNIEHKWVDDIVIFLLSPGGQFIELSSNNGANCDNYNNVCFTPTATTPINYVFPWPTCTAGIEPDFSNGTFLPEGVWSDLWDGSYPTNGTWQLLIIDEKNGFDGTLLDWTITFEPLYQVFYEWMPADGLSCTDCPEPLASPQQPTTYQLRAWDTYGCEVFDSVHIEVEDVLPPPNVICSNVGIGSITFTWDPVPGALGYQVSVDGGPWTNPNIDPLTHFVNGLTLEDTVSIAVFAIGECDGEIGTTTCVTPACDAPQINIVSQQAVDCPGNDNGAITISASGGNGGPYNYQLGGMANTSGIFTNLPAGTYQASAFDVTNCGNSIQITITEPTAIELQEVIINPISCFGIGDGVATVDVAGGSFPYNFSWDNSQNDSLATNLGPGSYTVIVTDANGCSSTLEINLQEPPQLNLGTQSEDVSCFGSNTGSSTATASGGTPPYQYQWDAAAGSTTSELAENLMAGSYTVVVTDLNGCQATAAAIIGQPTELTISTSGQNLSCANTQDGSATVVANGGTPAYTYLWSNGSTTATASNLDPIAYAVTVSDQNGCSAVDSITLTAPDPIVVAIVSTDATCFGENNGTATSSHIGGTAPFGFLWDNGAGSANLSGVGAGTYCLTVSDALSCTGSACVDILQPAEITLSTNITDAGCNGGMEGAIDLVVNGGTAPFNFIWNNGQITEDIAGLPAGSYEVTVQDANNCVASSSMTLTESDAIEISFQTNDVSCFGGSDGGATVTVTGGSGNFTFEWSGPNGYTSTAQNPSNMPGGNFTLIATDEDGCSALANLTIGQPGTAASVSIAPPGEICFNAANGTAVATASGGISPYTFTWSNGQTSATASALSAGSYTVTATDNNGCEATAQVNIIQQDALSIQLSQEPASCNGTSDGEASIAAITQGPQNIPVNTVQILWSIGSQTSPAVTGLTGGQSYTVTVTNSLGCTASASISIGNPAAVLAAISSTTDISCAGGNNGTATVSASGGSSPYSYLWSANANGQTLPTAVDLAAGPYTVTISDANGCTATASSSLTEPTPLQVEFDNQRVTCFGENDGSSSAKAEGGNPDYSFVWSNGQASGAINGLTAGTYALTVTDANGCTLEATTAIEQPAALIAGFTVQDVSCFGFSDGRIVVEVEGGSPPFRYSLDGGPFTGSPTQIALGEGFYQITVSDKNGCLAEMNDIWVQEPPAIVVNLGPDTIVDYGSTFVLNPTFENLNSQNAIYEWYSNNPQTQPAELDAIPAVFVVESPTSVTLTVTDEKGCTGEDLVNIFIKKFTSIEVPTGFAPGQGGSSLNEALHVHGNSKLVDQISLFRVYDRWGEVLYEASSFGINDTSIGWDGTFRGQDMPAGVYAWYLEVEFVDGTKESYKGNTTLIR
jgi:gliding motility-associated-like protein